MKSDHKAQFCEDGRDVAKFFLDGMMKTYWTPIYNIVYSNPKLKKFVTGFIVNPTSVSIYIGQKHIALEYHGSELYEDKGGTINMEVNVQDLSESDAPLLAQIIGFPNDSTVGFEFPLPNFSEDFICPTNRGFDALDDLGWNMAAQNSIMALNSPIPTPNEGEFSRIINGRFFDADKNGLVTRHVKWMDFFPIQFDGSDAEYDRIRFTLAPLEQMVEADSRYIYPAPTDYKFQKLPIINRFIELWGNSASGETEITRFLAEESHKFILTMKFGAVDAKPEIKCEWQSQQKADIKPDFFMIQPNGFADIVEFKLPHIGKSAVVGSDNRESFAAWLNSYISQTRVYANYFDDPNNRAWFEEKHKFRVYKPRRWLVVGRRKDFSPHEWREIIADYRDVDIITFDDLIDGTTAQFYR